MQWGIRCTMFFVLLVSPIVTWGNEQRSWRDAATITCPLCGTENDQTQWDTRTILRCTYCGLPLRYPQPLSWSARTKQHLAQLHASLGAMYGSFESEWNGYAASGPAIMDLRGTPHRDSTRHDASLRLQIQWKQDFWGIRSFVDGFAVADSRFGISGFEPFLATHPSAVGFREAFADFSVAETDVRVGKQLWSWGKSDLVHLVDVLNPEDRTRLFREERMGSVGVTLTRRFGDTDVDIVCIPRLSPTLLPDVHSRFAIAPFFTDSAALGNLHDARALRVARRDADIDWSLIMVDGAELMPSAIFASPFVPPTLFHPRRTLFGATGETIVEDFGFRGEAAYVAPHDHETDRYLAAVIGCDWSRNDLFAPRDRFYINVEGAVERVLAESNAVEFPRPMTRTLATKIEYQRDAWVPSLIVVHSFDHAGTRPALTGGDTYLEGALRWERTDHDDVHLRIVAPLGPAHSFFGAEKQNRSMMLSWEVKF